MLLDWSNIDTVLLDMDGTLLDLHFDNYFWLTHLPDALCRTLQFGPGGRYTADTRSTDGPPRYAKMVFDRLLVRRVWSGHYRAQRRDQTPHYTNAHRLSSFSTH